MWLLSIFDLVSLTLTTHVENVDFLAPLDISLDDYVIGFL